MKKLLLLSLVTVGLFNCGPSKEEVAEAAAKQERVTKDSLIEVNNNKQVVRVRDLKGNYMFLDENAEMLNGTKEYLGAEDFIGGYAAVEISDDKWVMINSIGEVVSKSYKKSTLLNKTLEKGGNRTIALNYANSEPELGDTTLARYSNQKKSRTYLEDQGYNDAWGNPAVKQVFVPAKVTLSIKGKGVGELQDISQWNKGKLPEFHKVKGSELKDFVTEAKVKQEALRKIKSNIDGMSYQIDEAEYNYKKSNTGSDRDKELAIKFRDQYIERAIEEYYPALISVKSSLTSDQKREINWELKRIKRMGVDPGVEFLK